MKQTSGPARKPAEAVIKDIRRATRRQFSAEEKIRIVLEGLRVYALRGVIAAHRLGGELALVAEALRPPAGTRHADPEAGCGAMAGDTRHHGSHNTLAQVHTLHGAASTRSRVFQQNRRKAERRLSGGNQMSARHPTRKVAPSAGVIRI
jgi:hypothetical protein